MIGSASGNAVDQNTVSGNTNGIYLAPGAIDNVIRENVIVGNPNIQTANARPNATAVDILNLSRDGQNTFQRNVCFTSVNAPCPSVTGGRPLRQQ